MQTRKEEAKKTRFSDAIKGLSKRAYNYARRHPIKTFFIILFFYLILSAAAIALLNRRENVIRDTQISPKLTDVPSSHQLVLSRLTPPPSPFLKNQTKIRSYVRSSPGFGDQKATFNVMRALKDRGFNGKFEVVYTKLAFFKIEQLFNLDPNSLTGNYYVDPKSGVAFIALDEYLERVQKNEIEQVNISLSVGRGAEPCSAAEMRSRNEDGKLNDFCSNYAKFLKSNIGLKFDYGLDEVSNTIIYRPNDVSIGLKDSGFDFYVFPVSTFNESLDYLQQDHQGKKLVTKKPGLMTFMQGIKDHAFQSTSVYGGSLLEMYCNKFITFYDKTSDCTLANWLQIISSMRYAQLHSPELNTHPLVISILFDAESELYNLNELLTSNTSHPSLRNILTVQSIIKDLQANLEIINVDHPSSVQSLQSLKPGKIYLLQIGTLPEIVFDGIYTHTDSNILPPIREGMSSLNSLILTGKPHFRCSSYWELGFVEADDKKLMAKLKNIYKRGGICDGIQTWERFPELYQAVGNLIIEARNDTSSLAEYFKKIKGIATSEKRNRIMNAINESERLISERRT